MSWSRYLCIILRTDVQFTDIALSRKQHKLTPLTLPPVQIMQTENAMQKEMQCLHPAPCMPALLSCTQRLCEDNFSAVLGLRATSII